MKHIPGTLTNQQRRFIDEYMKDHIAAKASVRAGLSYAAADHMFNLPHVKKEIKNRMKAIEKESEVTAAMVVKEAWRIANSDIGDFYDENDEVKSLSELTEDQRRAVMSIDVDKNRVNFWDKAKAVELLMKKFKLLTEKMEIGVSEDLASAIREARMRKKSAE